MRLLSSLTLGAVVAAWVVTTAATAPQPELVQGTPHAAIQEDQPGWNCTTMGNRVCGPHQHTASHDWVSEGYDGSDGSLAAWDCAHGRRPSGYGTEGMTCGPGYDLTHEDTGDTACWVEKITRHETAEVICGARGLRPANTADIGEVFARTTFDPCGWVASGPLADGYTIDPAGCN